MKEQNQEQSTNQTRDLSPSKNSYLWRNSLLVLLFISAVFLVIRVNLLTDTLEALQEDSDEMQARIDSLRAARLLSADSLGFTGLLTEYDIRQLQERGLDDPVNQLKADLLTHPELIPEEGVLGGTMRFYPDQIYLLSSRWVLAYYDDGHVAGELLLEYEVSPQGEVSWSVIDSG